MSFQVNIYTTSNRIESFIDKFRTKFAINFNQIKDKIGMEKKLAQNIGIII